MHARARRLAILGVTDQQLLQRMDPAQYTQWRRELEGHVAAHNAEEERGADVVRARARMRGGGGEGARSRCGALQHLQGPGAVPRGACTRGSEGGQRRDCLCGWHQGQQRP